VDDKCDEMRHVDNPCPTAEEVAALMEVDMALRFPVLIEFEGMRKSQVFQSVKLRPDIVSACAFPNFVPPFQFLSSPNIYFSTELPCGLHPQGPATSCSLC
jgi:hypothetical protein